MWGDNQVKVSLQKLSNTVWLAGQLTHGQIIIYSFVSLLEKIKNSKGFYFK